MKYHSEFLLIVLIYPKYKKSYPIHTDQVALFLE